VADWYAVTVEDRFLEYITKPSVMVFLFGVALTVDSPSPAAQVWFAIAVALSLAGDVFLMVPGDRFVPGLASFLGAHIAYVIGLLQLDLSAPFLAVGLVFAAVLLGTVGRKVIAAVRSSGQDALVIPVAVYTLAIAAMATAAFATGDGRAIVGALLFCSSDAMLGLDRFTEKPVAAPVGTGGTGQVVELSGSAEGPLGLPGPMRTWIHVTYHVGQALIILSLV
jgi:alkenylglycerophosphocholine/alkenylglycerophosphoethanolamine hydrolase